MKSIAIIPARGGSVRVPRKNLALFGNRPALSIVVETALSSGVFHSVLVSSDDAEILETGKQAGAHPLLRPSHLADDMCPILPVMQHAIDAFQRPLDAVCLIMPTAVFLEAEDLKTAHSQLQSSPNLDYVIGVRRFDSAPQRALAIDEDGLLSAEDAGAINKRTQDLKPLYHDTGMFSFGRVGAWQAGLHSFVAKTKGIEIDKYRAVDIDTPEDLDLARAIYEWRAGNQ